MHLHHGAGLSPVHGIGTRPKETGIDRRWRTIAGRLKRQNG